MHLSVSYSFFSRSWPSRRVRPRPGSIRQKAHLLWLGDPETQYVRDHCARWRNTVMVLAWWCPSIAGLAAGQT